jgi:Fe-S-cluster containining protein
MDTATSNTIVQYFQRLYCETDQRMALLNPVCQRGCPWCCYQSVEILNWEEPLISQYIGEKIRGEIKETIGKNLENWFDFFDRITIGKAELTMHDAFVFINRQQAKERIPCPFLTNNECSIYKVRPLSCRCHIAIENPEKCIVNPLLDSTIESEHYRKKVASDIVRNVPTTLRLLAFVVAPYFGIEHRTKPIYYTCLEPI